MDIDQLPDAPAFATSRGVKGNSFIPNVKRAKGNGNGNGDGCAVNNRRPSMDSVAEEGDVGILPSPGSNVLPQFKPRPKPAPPAPPAPQEITAAPAVPAPAASPAAPAHAPAPATAAEASSSNGGWRTSADNADNGRADDSQAAPASSYPSHLAEEDEEEVNQR